MSVQFPPVRTTNAPGPSTTRDAENTAQPASKQHTPANGWLGGVDKSRPGQSLLAALAPDPSLSNLAATVAKRRAEGTPPPQGTAEDVLKRDKSNEAALKTLLFEFPKTGDFFMSASTGKPGAGDEVRELIKLGDEASALQTPEERAAFDSAMLEDAKATVARLSSPEAVTAWLDEMRGSEAVVERSRAGIEAVITDLGLQGKVSPQEVDQLVKQSIAETAMNARAIESLAANKDFVGGFELSDVSHRGMRELVSTLTRLRSALQ